MYDTQVTLTGWIGSDVTTRLAGESTVASFRLAVTPRRFDRRNEQWVDTETQWYTVSAWRGLGDNCAASLHRGEAVVVHGRLSTQRWVNAAGVEMTALEIDAAFVGHDLNRGVSQFRKALRTEPVRPPAAETAEETREDQPAEAAAA